MDRTTKAAFLKTVIACIFWGFSGTCGQFLMSNKGIDSEILTTYRMVLAGLILLGIAFFTEREKLIAIWKNPRNVIGLICFGIFGMLICQGAYLKAISYSNAGTVTVLSYLGPIFIILFVCLQEKRLPLVRELIALVFAFSGVFILSTGGNINQLAISKPALFWGLASAFGIMTYTLIPSRMIREWGSIVVTGYGTLIGGLALSLYTKPWNNPMPMDWQIALGLGAIVGIGTVLAFSLYLKGVSQIGPVKASMIASIEPLAAVLFTATWLKTQFTITDFIGFFLILFAVTFVSVVEARSQRQLKLQENPQS